MLGLRLSISSSQGFYNKMSTSKSKFDEINVKSLGEPGSSSD